MPILLLCQISGSHEECGKKVVPSSIPGGNVAGTHSPCADEQRTTQSRRERALDNFRLQRPTFQSTREETKSIISKGYLQRKKKKSISRSKCAVQEKRRPGSEGHRKVLPAKRPDPKLRYYLPHCRWYVCAIAILCGMQPRLNNRLCRVQVNVQDVVVCWCGGVMCRVACGGRSCKSRSVVLFWSCRDVEVLVVLEGRGDWS
jgi:hypothetical protein